MHKILFLNKNLERLKLIFSENLKNENSRVLKKFSSIIFYFLKMWLVMGLPKSFAEICNKDGIK